MERNDTAKAVRPSTADRLAAGKTALEKMIAEVRSGADEMCRKGDHVASAQLRRMEAHLVMAQAEGRALVLEDGQIRPAFGGDRK